MHIVDLQGMSMVDFPGSLAAVLYTGGCDFRCPNCQNPDLVQLTPETPHFELEALWSLLEERKNWIDGLVITGGEPLLHLDLPELLAQLRQRTGLRIKVDTNGHHPEVLQRLLAEGNVDYVAMDWKAAPARYSEAAGKLVEMDRLVRSIELLMSGKVDYEFRTTVVPRMVDEAGIMEMGKLIKGARRWAFQQYQNRTTLDPKFRELKPLLPEKVRELALRAETFVEQVVIRGI